MVALAPVLYAFHEGTPEALGFPVLANAAQASWIVFDSACGACVPTSFATCPLKFPKTKGSSIAWHARAPATVGLGQENMYIQVFCRLADCASATRMEGTRKMASVSTAMLTSPTVAPGIREE